MQRILVFVLLGYCILAKESQINYSSPDISVSPDSIVVSLSPGDSLNRTLTIDNSNGTDSLFWSINISGAELGTVTFTKENNADWTLPENQDRITDNVWIARGNSQGLFNAATETSYGDGSPDDTEWSFGLTADLEPSDYELWIDAVDHSPQSMLDSSISLHLITDDLYYDVVFHSFTGGGPGGGFSYTRNATRNQWIMTSVDTGFTVAGNDSTVNILFDASSLEIGVYETDIVVSSNDPNQDTVLVPVVLNIVELRTEDEPEIAERFKLYDNYPNPFNPVTNIRYDLPKQSHVTITIYDLLGGQVKTLVNQTQDAGYKSVIWDATNSSGQLVSAGVYFYNIKASEFVQTKKVILLK